MILFRKFSFILFCSVAFIPLVFSKEAAYGMSVPRVLTFWTIVMIMAIVAIVACWKKNSLKINYSKLSIALFSYFVVLVVSSSFAESKYLSYFSNFERMDGIINYFFFVLFFLLFSNLNFNNLQWSLFLKLTCFVALLVSLTTIYQHFTQPLIRADSTLGNPLTLAFYLQVHIILNLIYIVNLIKSEEKNKILLLIAALSFSLIYIFAIYCTGSRSSVASLAFGIAFSFSFLFYKENSLRKGLIITVFVTIASLFFLLRHFNYLNLTKRITDLTFTDNSSLSRISLWKISIKHFYDKPIFGWGKENFIYFYSKYYNNDLVTSGEWYDHSHNFLIDKLVETGLIGFTFYLVFLLVILWCLLKSNINNIQKAGLLGLFVTYFFYHFANFENFPSNLFLFIFLIFIFQNSQEKAYFEVKLNKSKVAILVFFFLIFSYFFVWKTYKTYLHLNSINQTSFNLQSINFAFEESIIGKFDVGIKYAISRTEVIKYAENQKRKKEILDQIISHVNELLKIYPSHPILLSQLGFLFLDNGNLENAIKTYESLKEIAPNRHVNLMDLGMFYIRNKQFDKAINQFDEILKFDNSYKLAQINKAFCFTAQGNVQESNKILNDLEYLIIIENLDKCTDLYRLNNNYAGLLKKLSNKNLVGVSGVTPSSFLRRVQLAVILNDKSEVEKAIYGYINYFFIEVDEVEIKDLISNIQTRKLPPEAFYEKFESVIWW